MGLTRYQLHTTTLALILTLLSKNIDVSKISVSKPNVLDNGAKLIYVNYENEKKFKIQTPKMVLPFGLNEYSEGPYPKYSVELRSARIRAPTLRKLRTTRRLASSTISSLRLRIVSQSLLLKTEHPGSRCQRTRLITM